MTSEIVTLTEPKTGDTATIAPGLGCNCFSWQVQGSAGLHEMLWSHPQFADGSQRPSRSGIPLLFPFPGRVRGHSVKFRGTTYPLNVADDTRGNAIHGFVLNRAWSIVDQSATRLACRFQAKSVEPSILTQWPSDFTLHAVYELLPGRLELTIQVENSGQAALPWALGMHPYFRLPLGPEGTIDDCIIQIPTRRYWETDNMLPTGQVIWPEAKHLPDGMRYGDLQLDHCLTDVQFDGLGWAKASVLDSASGRRLDVSFDHPFTQIVAFTPVHREAICIEPYTAVPNSLELTEQGLNVGLQVLEPGQTALARMAMEVGRLEESA